MYKRMYIYFFVSFLVVVSGFMPSYFLELGENVAAHHIHSLSAILWYLLLISQAVLIKQKKNNLHRIIGKASFVLAPVVIGSAFQIMYVSQTDLKMDAFWTLTFFMVDHGMILAFAFSYFLAVRFTKQIQLHARFMAITALVVLPAPLSRLMGASLIPDLSGMARLNIVYILVEVIFVIILFRDRELRFTKNPFYFFFISILVIHGIVNFAGNSIIWAEYSNLYISAYSSASHLVNIGWLAGFLSLAFAIYLSKLRGSSESVS